MDRLGYFWIAMLLVSWLQPLHFLPWLSWHTEIIVFVGVTMVAWHAIVCRPSYVVPALAWPFLGLTVVVVIQVMTGVMTYAGDALVLAQYLLLCVVCLTLGFNAVKTSATSGEGADKALPPMALVVASALVTGAFLSAVVALGQALEVWHNVSWILQPIEIRRPGANLGQPNHLATLIVMGLASLVYLHQLEKIKSGIAITIFAVLAIGLAVAESRTGALSFIALAVWCWIGRKRAGLSLAAWITLLGGLAAAAVYAAWPKLMAGGGGYTVDADINYAPGGRLEVWPQLIEAVTLRPWAGWGLREVSEAHNAVVDRYLVSEPFSYSHNILLDLAVGAGLPLTALLVLATSVWLSRRLRSAKTPTTWFCLAAVLPVALHSMLEFPFAYAYFLAPVMLLLGMLEALSGGKWQLAVQRHLLAGVLLLYTVIGAWTIFEYLEIEEDFRVVRFESLRVGRTPVEHQIPQVHLLTQLEALLHGGRIKPRPGMTEREIELARNTAMRYPWPATQNRYALCLVLNDQQAEGLRQLRVMQVMHGPRKYQEIKSSWEALGREKYPQILVLQLP